MPLKAPCRGEHNIHCRPPTPFRSFSFGVEGYNECVWDGKDENGEVAANGVYVGKITALFGDKTSESKIKIVKIK